MVVVRNKNAKESPKDRSSSFKLLATYEITVPENYDHATQLASFRKEYLGIFDVCEKQMSDKNFARVTDKLGPGKTYKVEIFRTINAVYPEDELAFLKKQKALLVGAQGLSLFWQLKKQELSVLLRPGMEIISVDERDALIKLDNDVGQPSISHEPNGEWFFYAADDDWSWADGICIVSFHELK